LPDRDACVVELNAPLTGFFAKQPTAARGQMPALRTSPTARTLQAGNGYLGEVRSAPKGRKVAALFDFDGTVIAGFSAFALLREKFARGQMTRQEALDTLEAVVQYARGAIGYPDLMTVAARHMQGTAVDDFAAFSEQLFEKRIAPRIYPETRALIEAHRARGHTVAIVSSATPYQIGPAARALGIDRVLCSHYEIDGGRFTGKYVSPLCFGADKLRAVEALAAAEGLDLKRSFFYSDSHDDLDLLARVGRPRPLNPNRQLADIAASRGWPTQRFTSRGTPRLRDYARGLSPIPILVGSVLASLPMLALTRSARETTNFVIGAFGDYGSAAAGIDLQLRGEQNLWTARPCIFVFNHQSQADVLIMAKLLRRDITGIGKRELRDVPVVGRLLELGGMVFVDRRKSADAVKAMAPLVDAIRRDRQSVCIAPEGSRSATTRLGAFKKGAFHLAMQAHVPIVPVVIHNSADVQPKNEFVMRPAAVRVEVQPPVDTSTWHVATLDRHVREVRNLFLRALGQPEERSVAATVRPKTSAQARPRERARAQKTRPVRARSARRP
jgi:putative phosphoserine phosphatase/1-acylglycerol-3-phosphate O-acyltransferase